MNIFKNFFNQCARPKGFLGRAMLNFMNFSHSPLNIWGFSFIEFNDDMKMLDVGCGGGATIKRLIKRSQRGKAYGIDISEESIKKAKEVNCKLLDKQVFLEVGSVEHLNFCEEMFDLVTAVETVYFWPNIVECFKEVKRVLKPNGQFAIILETANDSSHWQNIVDGMKVYTTDELKEMLEKAGFVKVDVHIQKPSYVTIIAK